MEKKPTDQAPQPVRFQAEISGTTVQYFSKPGIPHWKEVSPAAHLLARAYIELQPGRNVLIMGCAHGAVPAALAKQFPAATFWLRDLTLQAVQLATLTLAENRLENAFLVEPIPELTSSAEQYDFILMELPKGRSLARRWIVEAWRQLVPGGNLLLGGANDLGIQAVLRDAGEVFGAGGILAYKKGNRVARFRKSPQPPGSLPAWASEPGIAPGTWGALEVQLRGRPANLASIPGVFSADGLDEASELLLGVLPASTGKTVLDVGCGWGALGLAAALDGAAQVDMVDNFFPAIAAAAENIRRLGVTQARAFPGDALSAPEIGVYQRILTNPPFHAGRAIEQSTTQAIISGAAAHLAPGGDFWLVANSFLPYEAILKQVFQHVRIVEKTPRFQVFCSQNS